MAQASRPQFRRGHQARPRWTSLRRAKRRSLHQHESRHPTNREPNDRAKREPERKPKHVPITIAVAFAVEVANAGSFNGADRATAHGAQRRRTGSPHRRERKPKRVPITIAVAFAVEVANAGSFNGADRATAHGAQRRRTGSPHRRHDDGANATSAAHGDAHRGTDERALRGGSDADPVALDEPHRVAVDIAERFGERAPFDVADHASERKPKQHVAVAIAVTIAVAIAKREPVKQHQERRKPGRALAHWRR